MSSSHLDRKLGLKLKSASKLRILENVEQLEEMAEETMEKQLMRETFVDVYQKHENETSNVMKHEVLKLFL